MRKGSLNSDYISLLFQNLFEYRRITNVLEDERPREPEHIQCLRLTIVSPSSESSLRSSNGKEKNLH